MTATGLGVGGDVEQALGGIGVPSYVLDTTGIVRWINPAAERLLGDVRGRHFTSVVAPEDSHRARESFSRKVLGTATATETTGVLVSTTGRRVDVELSAVPLAHLRNYALGLCSDGTPLPQGHVSQDEFCDTDFRRRYAAILLAERGG